MGKEIDTFACMVQPLVVMVWFCVQVLVVLRKRRNKVKLLVWDRHGIWLLYNRLEGGRFPQPEALAARGLSMGELTAWLEGIDLTRARRLRVIDATRVA